MEFSEQEYRRLAMPPPGNLPGPGMEPVSLTSSALAGGIFTTGVKTALWGQCSSHPSRWERKMETAWRCEPPTVTGPPPSRVCAANLRPRNGAGWAAEVRKGRPGGWWASREIWVSGMGRDACPGFEKAGGMPWAGRWAVTRVG